MNLLRSILRRFIDVRLLQNIIETSNRVNTSQHHCCIFTPNPIVEFNTDELLQLPQVIDMVESSNPEVFEVHR